MPIALFDTNAVSDLMRDHPQLKHRIGRHQGTIATSVVVLGEIRFGLERMPAGKKRQDLESRSVTILSAIPTETVSPSIAQAYGQLKASLEGQGLNLDDNDLWIAATAIAQGMILVTRDRLFSRITGLLVENWAV